MAKTDIKTGVIGVGSMGQNHARIYNNISNLVGVFDLEIDQRNLVADRFGVKSFDSLESLLKEVEAVTIAVPTVFHRDVALKALEMGTHVIIEKPMSDSVESSKEILQAFAETPFKLAVGHIERHNNVVKLAKEKLDSGIWGKLISITARRFSNYPVRISDVGVIFDLSIHDIDVLNYLVSSDLDTVYCSGNSSKNSNHEDNVNIVLNYSNGVIGVCQTNWLTPMKVRELLLTTSTHHIRVDYINQEITSTKSVFVDVDESNLYNPLIEIKEEKFETEKCEPLLLELLDFLSSIKENRRPFVAGGDGLRAVKIAHSALESMVGNKLIYLGDDK